MVNIANSREMQIKTTVKYHLPDQNVHHQKVYK